MKVITVVGTRPEFIQTAPVSKAIRARQTEILVHTGQHYDHNMSDVFFAELDLPEPEYNLGVGSGSHARQTGQIMIELERVILDEEPDWVLVYGDTNSTIAAGLTAAKLHIPVAHVEAGLRSFDRAMPEEINRVITDHISDLLFAPTQAAVANLKREGIVEGVRMVGDVRVDVLTGLVERVRGRFDQVLQATRLARGEAFALATIHRPSNTDAVGRLRAIVETLSALELPVVLPVHPRLGKMLNTFGLDFGENVRTIPPASFLDMVVLLDGCEIVITDSGGLQKEAYILRRPTVTVRDSTEWVETVEAGWNRLCEPDPASFRAAVAAARAAPPAEHPDFYGAPGVGARICAALEEALIR
ncbi:MAG: UDP-N-acetylglucosamine 2-epimerase (non-hydrolyzing) [Anaerolineae bacterium]|nr:UDP-N-acetylglucosamine 2-epimerase (non-hydrolyzing) [Anaerolineae bacterium]